MAKSRMTADIKKAHAAPSRAMTSRDRADASPPRNPKAKTPSDAFDASAQSTKAQPAPVGPSGKSKAKMTADRTKAQLAPVSDPAQLTSWWGMPFGESYHAVKVQVVGRRAGVNGEDFLSFKVVGDATKTRPLPSPFEVDLNAGGALVWPHLPSTAQLVDNPKGPAPYGYLFVTQTWATSVGIPDARYYAEAGGGNGGGTGGGKWPIAAG